MVLVDQWFVRDGTQSAELDLDTVDRYIVALADGMGGHNSGEVASSDVLHNLQFFFSDLPVSLSIADFNEAIYEWLSSINYTIDSKGKSDPRFSKMGTTLVAFLYYNGHFFWMNCGDSRIYRLHDGHLRQLSTDHSLSNLLGEEGHSHVITNCIGGGCKNSFIDIVECTADIQPGDQFLVCSDGLTDMLSDQRLAELLAAGSTADMLCLAAEDAGGFDNVSSVVVKVL
jgi:protein phosphatase